jgi:hypothetical protein
MLFMGIVMALLLGTVLIKVTFCALRVVVSLIFLPIVILPLIIVGAVFCMVAVILGLIALPIVLPVLLILFIFLVLPFAMIKHLIF